MHNNEEHFRNCSTSYNNTVLAELAQVFLNDLVILLDN